MSWLSLPSFLSSAYRSLRTPLSGALIISETSLELIIFRRVGTRLRVAGKRRATLGKSGGSAWEVLGNMKTLLKSAFPPRSGLIISIPSPNVCPGVAPLLTAHLATLSLRTYLVTRTPLPLSGGEYTREQQALTPDILEQKSRTNTRYKRVLWGLTALICTALCTSFPVQKPDSTGRTPRRERDADSTGLLHILARIMPPHTTMTRLTMNRGTITITLLSQAEEELEHLYTQLSRIMTCTFSTPRSTAMHFPQMYTATITGKPALFA